MRERLLKLKNNTFVQGSVLLTISGFAVGFFNYVFNSLSSKILSPSGYSEISTLFAYLAVFSIPIGALQIETIRRIGTQTKNRLKTLADWLDEFRTILAPNPVRLMVFLLLYSGLILVLPSVTNLQPLTAAALLILLPLVFLNSLQEAVFKGLKWFKVLALILVTGGVLKVSGAIGTYLAGGGLTLLLISLIVSTLLTLIFFTHVRKDKLPTPDENAVKQDPSPSRLSQLLYDKPLRIIAFSYLGFALFNNLDMIVAKQILAPDTAGVYGAWDLLSKMILYLSAPTLTISLVFFSSPEHKKNHLTVLFLALVGQFAIGILGYFGYTLFGEPLIRIIFTAEYLSVLPLIGLAAFFGLLYAQIGFINNFFMANQSHYSLILPVLIPIYAVAMLVWGKTIHRLVWTNLIFGGATLIIYLLALLRYRSIQLNKP